MQKSELLRTIEILFWENSFSDLSMDAIAEKLEMKKASLYYHFPSKEAMFLAVVELSYETYREFLERALTPNPSPKGRGETTPPHSSAPLRSEGEFIPSPSGRGLGGGPEVQENEATKSLISSLVLFPYREKNLFAIVSQKGYCQIEEVHRFINEKSEEIRKYLSDIFCERFSWNNERSILFLSLIDSLSKRCSLEQCERKDMRQILDEIIVLFF